jgi:hypothetical protein
MLLTMESQLQEFDPKDLWGEWGIYHDSSTLRVSNLRVSHISDEKGSGK